MYLRRLVIGGVVLASLAGTTATLRAQPATQPATPTAAPTPGALPFDAQLASVLRTAEGISLVGRSGQLYESTGEHRWLRKNSGGVSTNVKAIYQSTAGKLFAVGDRAPLFSYENGVWAAFPLARKGSAAANSGSLPIIALRRKIYELGTNGWRPIGTGPAVVDQLWAASSKRIVLSDVKGQLWAGHGEVWRRIKISLATDDRIAKIVGLPGGLIVALTAKGFLYSIGKRLAKPLRAAGVGPILKVQMVAVANRKLLAIGQAENTNRLYEIGGKMLTPIVALWPLQQGDRFVMITSVASSLLIATEQGQAQIRQQDGSWHPATIGIQRPSPPMQFSNVGPARSR